MVRARYDMVSAYLYRRMADGPEFLLLRRTPGDYMGGTWQPVFGGIREGETAATAALREIAEETGLTPIRFHQIDSVLIFYVAKMDTVYHAPVFAAEIATDAAIQLNQEHDAYEWRPVAEAIGRFIWPGQRSAAREVVDEVIVGGAAVEYLEIALD